MADFNCESEFFSNVLAIPARFILLHMCRACHAKAEKEHGRLCEKDKQILLLHEICRSRQVYGRRSYIDLIKLPQFLCPDM